MLCPLPSTPGRGTRGGPAPLPKGARNGAGPFALGAAALAKGVGCRSQIWVPPGGGGGPASWAD
eukprot:14418130-Alexandrium_andersonii.AAC.1